MRQTISMISRFFRLSLLLATMMTGSFAAGPVVIFIGAPGAGKSTQAEILRKERGMVLISADALIASNRNQFQRYKNPLLDGVDPLLDPALNPLVEQALRNADLSKGVVIDGYPAAVTQGNFLGELAQKMSLPKATVIHLKITDAEARKRLPTTNVIDLAQDLKNYHREADFAGTYFPNTALHEVDGMMKPADVAKAIAKILDEK
jgi:adenylate kinase family enzyme